MLATLFVLSFTVALTGAVSPGPLLTYTISKSLEGRKGFLVGLYVCAGHALLEGVLLTFLLYGASFLVMSDLGVVYSAIGVVGGAVLLAFAGAYLSDVARGAAKLDLDLVSDGGQEGGEDSTTKTTGPKRTSAWRLVAGGALVSTSNPFWWIWWVSVGLNLLLTNLVSLSTAAGVLAFFLGHEAGDVAWYVLVAALVHAGRRKVNQRAYSAVLVGCSLFMAALGLYFLVWALA
ncbi:MAG: LysE family transporter [Promethearchaeota archaeon]